MSSTNRCCAIKKKKMTVVFAISFNYNYDYILDDTFETSSMYVKESLGVESSRANSYLFNMEDEEREELILNIIHTMWLNIDYDAKNDDYVTEINDLIKNKINDQIGDFNFDSNTETLWIDIKINYISE